MRAGSPVYLANRLDRITSRDITRAYGSLRPPECRKEMGDVTASLVVAGWLEPEAPSNALKPVSSWLVNPAVHTKFAEKAAAERATRQQTKEAIAATIEELKKKSWHQRGPAAEVPTPDQASFTTSCVRILNDRLRAA
jgi:hypothetical protein